MEKELIKVNIIYNSDINEATIIRMFFDEIPNIGEYIIARCDGCIAHGKVLKKLITYESYISLSNSENALMIRPQEVTIHVDEPFVFVDEVPESSDLSVLD